MIMDSGNLATSKFDEPVIRLLCRSTAGDGYDELSVCVIELTEHDVKSFIRTIRFNRCLYALDHSFLSTMYNGDHAYWYESIELALGALGTDLSPADRDRLEAEIEHIEDNEQYDCEWVDFPTGINDRGDAVSAYECGQIEFNHNCVYFTCYHSYSEAPARVESQGIALVDLEIYLAALQEMQCDQISSQKAALVEVQIRQTRTRVVQVDAVQ